MTGYPELVVVAAIAQLAVLPGEKVQFIIAGLSTRYRPAIVVAAAATAFAAWTAVEIAFGAAVQEVLPPVALDAVTAGLFLLFAVLLLRSAPAADAGPHAAETDGGDAALPSVDGGTTVLGREVSGRVGSFVSIFTLLAAGEFGDKTQLVTIGLAAQYGASSAIWVGEMLVIVPVSLANAYLFHRFSHRFDVRKAYLVGAMLFAFFGFDAVLTVLTGFSVWETIVGGASQAVLGPL
ncbi:TMEM165/GDT1 family protein [Halorarum salinum]|uniref:TMEM165/GDT1 family protein n=1 Tax=Halorarum salinum TaxID=2743089 RepID=A0A7D5LCU3_9EURY|nr:TMEM165/GDT1 family protein [Halobaculum salinum]QLG63574.1 TMEM165/GDT1 family protein [Halobaculum salinum]